MNITDKTFIIAFDPNNKEQCDRLTSILMEYEHSQWTKERIDRALKGMHKNSNNSIYITLDYIYDMKDDGHRSDIYVSTDLNSLKHELDQCWGDMWKKYNILGTGAGDSFNNVALRAAQLAQNGKNTIFDFNGIECIVSTTTDVTKLFRDYLNAHAMEVTEVGPDCISEYSKEIQDKITAYQEKRDEEMNRQNEVWTAEAKTKKELLMGAIKDVTLNIIDQAYWDQCKAINNDAYSGRCVSYAEEWGKLMQVKIEAYLNTATTPDIKAFIAHIANETSNTVDYDGITGAMFGAATNILCKTWVYGEELKKCYDKN